MSAELARDPTELDDLSRFEAEGGPGAPAPSSSLLRHTCIRAVICALRRSRLTHYATDSPDCLYIEAEPEVAFSKPTYLMLKIAGTQKRDNFNLVPSHEAAAELSKP